MNHREETSREKLIRYGIDPDKCISIRLERKSHKVSIKQGDSVLGSMTLPDDKTAIKELFTVTDKVAKKVLPSPFE